MTDRYEDCESCAFGGQDHAICDECDEADQWEPEFEDSLMVGSPKVIKFMKKNKNKDEERMYG